MFYNEIKTVLLMGALSGILLMLGNLIGGHEGMIAAFIMALLINGIAYFFSDKIVLSLYKAKPLSSEQHKEIYASTGQLAATMQIPMPKLYLIDNKMANAFATGRNPGNACVALTTGILELLNKEELRAVLAHELSHIKNRDILISTIAATLATAIGYMARFAPYSSNRGKRQNNNFLVTLIIALFIPLAAMLIQLAISRSREYLADETGAQSCRDPLALASALEKLHNHIPYASMNSNDIHKASTAPLFIMHPFAGNSWTSLFATHPSIGSRVARLQMMYKKMF